MTESEWLACTDPGKMLRFLHGKASDRQLRLFSVGCIRRGWHRIKDPNLRRGVEAIERFVDGCARDKDRTEARNTGLRVARTTGPQWSLGAELRMVATKTINLKLACELGAFAAAFIGGAGGKGGPKYFRAKDAERAQQQVVLRDIFGNPFCPIALNPTWQTPTVLALATAAYDNRTLPAGTLEPARLAVLADALEEAGCDNADILGHLRGPGEHVRGCWVVDLVLGKE